MEQDKPQVAWILTLQYKMRRLGQANYFYALGANHTKLITTLVARNFEPVPDSPYNEDVDVRVGLLHIYRKRLRDSWAIGHDPHHYHLPGADVEKTIGALQDEGLKHTTNITDAVEGALGEPWDLRLS